MPMQNDFHSSLKTSAILTLSWNLPLALPSIGSADFSKEVP